MIATTGLFKFKQLFPGFEIYDTNVSFINKYANLFTFMSLIVGIIGLFWFDIYKQRKSEKSKTKEEVNNT